MTTQTQNQNSNLETLFLITYIPGKGSSKQSSACPGNSQPNKPNWMTLAIDVELHLPHTPTPCKGVDQVAGFEVWAPMHA